MIKYGGLKIKDQEQSSFDAVLTMIEHPEANLTSLSYTSLSGFLFRLDIPTTTKRTEVPFLGLNASGTMLNQPIYTLVFKFSVITEDRPPRIHALKIDKHRRYKKQVEPLKAFTQEAAIQQHIYLNTLSPNGKPICLAVADFTVFDSADATTSSFIDLLVSKVHHPDPNAIAMLEYLRKILNRHNDLKLGMISMELAEPIPENPGLTLQDCKRTLAQIIILFVQFKHINFDFHAGNVICTQNTSYLIDFGRVSNLQKPMTKYFLKTYRRRFRKSYHFEYTKLMDLSITDFYLNKKNEISVVENLQNVIEFIKNVDVIKNSEFTKTEFRLPQMQHLLDCVFHDGGETHPLDHLLDIAHLIREMTEAPTDRSTNALSRKAIRNMIQQGRIFSFALKDDDDDDEAEDEEETETEDEDEEEETEDDEEISSSRTTAKSRKRSLLSFLRFQTKKRRSPPIS